jgi:hypothetical protein
LVLKSDASDPRAVFPYRTAVLLLETSKTSFSVKAIVKESNTRKSGKIKKAGNEKDELLIPRKPEISHPNLLFTSHH